MNRTKIAKDLLRIAEGLLRTAEDDFDEQAWLNAGWEDLLRAYTWYKGGWEDPGEALRWRKKQPGYYDPVEAFEEYRKAV